MSKHIAIILSGCGVYDGAEIHESVLTLLRLDQQEATVQCFAPDMPQHHVVNHINGQEMPEQRNVLVEAGRIARGQVKDIREASADHFDALIIPGGFGSAKNLCDFAVAGAQCKVQPDVLALAQSFARKGKVIGLMCISPVMAPAIFGKGVRCTIGNDPITAAVIAQMGGEHVDCSVDGIVVDESRRLVTTPAYMLGKSVAEVSTGIFKLVDKVLALA